MAAISISQQRILLVYHLLLNLEEVSMRELSRLPCSRKTVLRDIALMREAGVGVKFVPPHYYQLTGKLQTPKPGDPSIHNQKLQKLHRLFYMMEHLAETDCDLWYRRQFPGLSLRTMQRDFAVLNQIGYRITYERNEINDHDSGTDVPVRHYYCDFPDPYEPFDAFIEQHRKASPE